MAWVGGLCFLLLIASVFAADVCQFRVPGVNSTGCYHFDLSKAAGQTYTMAQSKNSTFMVSVCGNVKEPPSQCKGKPPAPAYQIYDGACYVLGLLNETLMYPVDPQDPQRGIRIVYRGGDNSSDGMDRAVILDFIYYPHDNGTTLRSVVEYPPYTYRFMFSSVAVAPTSHSETEACPTPAYQNNWRSLAFRPIPSWFDNVKFGIFLHWGVFSVPAYRSEWYWHMLMTGEASVVQFHNRVYGCSGIMPDKFPCTGPPFKYADFAPMFKAELFDPDHWASVFKAAGAKYVVLTSKHHEGWCNFPSPQHWNWNSMDIGPFRDLVGNLTSSVRKAGLHMGLYHSLREWYNPIYEEDNANNCSTTAFVDDILLPTLKDMVMKYQPEVIWADGAGDAPCTHDSVKYWKAPNFISWLYNESPVKDTVLVNSRWGSGSGGDYTTGPDRYTPGQLIPEKWESCYTIQKGSWGYDRSEDLSGFINASHLIYQLVTSVAFNGNLLLNIGPTHDGRILPEFEQRLMEIGAWLKVNGEAIYNSTPYRVQFDTNAKQILYTSPKDEYGLPDWTTVYVISFVWPQSGDLVLTQLNSTDHTTVAMMGYNGQVKHSQGSDGLHIALPTLTPDQLPSTIAWVFKLANMPMAY